MEGIWGDVWHSFLEMNLNFTTNLKYSPDGSWGALQDDGTWDGIINSILQNRTQIGLADFYITYERQQVVDFSPSLIEGRDRMFIRRPRQEASWETYLRPFSYNLWMGMLCMILLMQLCLYITQKFDSNRIVNGQEELMMIPLIIWRSMTMQVNKKLLQTKSDLDLLITDNSSSRKAHNYAM